MNVLSLFDGMSCGQLALKKLGITPENYFASEIDKPAIKVAKHNFPDTIHLGDVREVKPSKLPIIHLLIGGSPCQGFSFSGKQLNFEDPRSKLFFEFVRVLNEAIIINPKIKFMLENVRMKKEFQDIISSHLGVEPIEINSSLVSAQCRRRLYWTNIEGVSQPSDKNILLSDILDTDDMKQPTAIRGRRLYKGVIVGRRLNESGNRDDYNKLIPLIQCLEVRATNTNKSNCITTVDKDNVLTIFEPGRYPDVFKKKYPFRYYSTGEYCKLQTVPEGYFKDIVSNGNARIMLGNGWTIDVISHILGHINISEL